MKIIKAAGWTAAALASLAGYGLSVTSHAHASEPGHAVRAPRWLAFQAATSADRQHFHVHGKCVIELAGSGHGWIVCRNGESARIPLDVGQVVTMARVSSEPSRITLANGETGLALDSLRWQSAGKARGQLDYTGEGAGQVGTVRVTVRRAAAGSIAALTMAGNTAGVAKSWTFSHGHWSAS